MIDTDRMWERWGRIAPYFGVLADPRFANERIADHRDEFFASGRGQVDHILTSFERHFGPLGEGRALDHGCGVGRLTLPLAERFAEVVGLDISSAMLAEAESNARTAGAGNVRFALANDALSRAGEPFDFVNSYIVLQHIPVRRGLGIFRRLIDLVYPGGGFHLHLSVRTDRRRARALWWASANIPGVKIAQNILARRNWNAPAMQMNNYPLAELLVFLAERGIGDVLVQSERHGPFLTLSLFGRVPQRSAG